MGLWETSSILRDSCSVRHHRHHYHPCGCGSISSSSRNRHRRHHHHRWCSTRRHGRNSFSFKRIVTGDSKPHTHVLKLFGLAIIIKFICIWLHKESYVFGKTKTWIQRMTKKKNNNEKRTRIHSTMSSFIRIRCFSRCEHDFELRICANNDVMAISRYLLLLLFIVIGRYSISNWQFEIFR